MQPAEDLGELESVLHLCVAQWWLYESRKYADDLVATHAIGINAAAQLGRPLVKALLFWQGRKLFERGDHAEAIVHLERALARMAELDREHDRAQILDALGDVRSATDIAAATGAYEQAARIFETGGHLLAAAAVRKKLDLLAKG